MFNRYVNRDVNRDVKLIVEYRNLSLEENDLGWIYLGVVSIDIIWGVSVVSKEI